MDFEARKVLIVAPHPDDEVIACGGAITKFVEMASTVRVLYYGGRDRSDEAVAGMEVLGVSDDHLFFCNSRDKVGSVLHQLRTFNPELIFFPSLYDRHPDHETVHRLMFQVLKYAQPPFVGEMWTYGVWQPIERPDFVLDVSEVFERKLDALRAHDSQIRDFDVLGLCRSVNHLYYLRDMEGKEENGYAEAFLKISF